MKRNLVFLFAGLLVVWFLAGCATTRGPVTMEEMNPQWLSSRDGDPRVGVLVFEGDLPAIVEIRNSAGQMIKQWSEAGAMPPQVFKLRINGELQRSRPTLRYYIISVSQDDYRIIARPISYVNSFGLPILNSRPEGQVVYVSFSVDYSCDTYDEATGMYWGWMAWVNTGYAPRNKTRVPAVINMDVQASGLPGLLINGLKRNIRGQ